MKKLGEHCPVMESSANLPLLKTGYRIAWTTTIALAILYAAMTTYQMSTKYGANAHALTATIEDLNADAYDMLWAIAGQFGASTDHGRRAMRDIIICSPERPRTYDESRLYADARDKVKIQIFRHAGYAYLALKHAIESGARNIKVDLQRAYPQYQVYDVRAPEYLVCTHNAENEIMREIARIPPSVYYGEPAPLE